MKPPPPRWTRSPPGGAAIIDVREASEWEQGHLPGAVHISKSYIEQQIEGAVPDRDAPVVLYCAGGVRSLFAAQTLADMGYTERQVDGGRLPGLEGRGPRVRHAGRPLGRAEAALQPPPADPRGRLGRPGEAPRLEGAVHRRRRARLAGRALPRGGGRRDDRPRRLRRRRRQQPAAPDHPHDRPGRRAQGRIRADRDPGAQPRDQGRRPRGDAGRRERRADHRGLRRDPRRHRHLRDPLHPQRRGGRGRDPGDPRLGLPLRGPAHDLRPVRGAVLPLPVPDPAAARARPRLLRGRRPRRRAGHPRPAPGERGAQGAPRDRQHARRPAAPVRCPRDRVHRAEAPPRPGMPGLLGQGRRRPQGRPPADRGQRSATTSRSR